MNERDQRSDDPGDANPAMPSASTDQPVAGDASDEADDVAVRRPLIRATLQLPPGSAPAPRQPPVFTMHQQMERSTGGRPPQRGGRSGRNSGNAPGAGQYRHKKSGGQPGNSSAAPPPGNRKWGPRPDRANAFRSEASPRNGSPRRDKDRRR